jgi:putative two-component system response regulator
MSTREIISGGFMRDTIRLQTERLYLNFDSLEESEHATIRSLMIALKTRDVETYEHSARVVPLSILLGRERALDETELRALEFGSLLHDIGKIGVPDAVLRKPSRLTDEEWMMMRRHPQHGERILAGIKFLEGAARVVSQHHERWDGKGYPLGLQGEQIDLNARILAVSDAFDVMTSDRVYRPRRSFAAAVAELDRCAGTQFDPEIVAAFHRIQHEDWQEPRDAWRSFPLMDHSTAGQQRGITDVRSA